MKNYTFKLNNEEKEFAYIEVSEMMRKFLEMCEKETTMVAENEDYKIYNLHNIFKHLEENASFERGITNVEYANNLQLFREYCKIVKDVDCEFIGIKKNK